MKTLACRYSRKQAIRKGLLFDVSSLARKQGYFTPVAITPAVWTKCVIVPRELRSSRNIIGSLWDVLCDLNLTAQETAANSVEFKTLVENSVDETDEVSLVGNCGLGDYGKPVVTITFPDEVPSIALLGLL